MDTLTLSLVAIFAALSNQPLKQPKAPPDQDKACFRQVEKAAQTKPAPVCPPSKKEAKK